MAVGCEPGAIGSFGSSSLIHLTTFPLMRSSSATCEAFHRLHQARLPSRVATTVYGNDDGTRAPTLRSKLCRTLPFARSSSTTLSDRLLATRSLSGAPATEIKANPAG